jgi:hypothetical protein
MSWTPARWAALGPRALPLRRPPKGNSGTFATRLHSVYSDWADMGYFAPARSLEAIAHSAITVK